LKDRVPTKPNRYAVYDDNHNFLRYEYHERADEPTEEGTPLTKATLLSDTTAALLGLSENPTVNDALVLQATSVHFDEDVKFTDILGNILGDFAQIEAGSYTGTGTYGEGSPNSIVFSFIPKLVIVTRGDTATSIGVVRFLLWVGGEFTASNLGNGNARHKVDLNGTTFSWYSDANPDASRQMNSTDIEYFYMALS
jgi:hypothetical protein